MKSYISMKWDEKIRTAWMILLKRNSIICHDWSRPAKKKCVNINYFRIDDSNDNLGDYLSVVVCEEMCRYFDLEFQVKDLKNTKHLYAIGSVLFTGLQDCTVWGTGLIREYNKTISEKIVLYFNKRYRKLDIRSVRGPLTRRFLEANGIHCPEIYGDPALLMPFFYNPKNKKKWREYVCITHYTVELNEQKNTISMKTRDYKYVINCICEAKKVITSSLHGLILAEAYGVPAVVFSQDVEFDKFKYDDYYLSTGRSQYHIAKSLQEALEIDPLPLPDLKILQEGLMNTFPKDLWE